jgi:hypothetical protein
MLNRKQAVRQSPDLTPKPPIAGDKPLGPDSGATDTVPSRAQFQLSTFLEDSP